MDIDPTRVLNVNVGVLGHVDSGKTSLVKALSTHLSTAALDKSKESQQRGMTLDLGFSAFTMAMPDHLRQELTQQGLTRRKGPGSATAAEPSTTDEAKSAASGDTLAATGAGNATTECVTGESELDTLQITLVDCPGHASLIRTIIGGAQIIDLMMLVIDVNKGIQTQTAECLVIGEIMSDNLIIALNKIDMIPEAEREEKVRLAERGIRKALAGTKFAHVPMVPVASRVGGEKVAAMSAAQLKKQKKKQKKRQQEESAAVASRADAGGAGAPEKNEAADGSAEKQGGAAAAPEVTLGLDKLVSLLTSHLHLPARHSLGSFIFSVDHCFQIRGQGTVLTGTVVGGAARITQTVEIPSLGVQKRIKSIQMFRQPVESCMQGDRIGLCVTGLDAKQMERGIVVSPPGSMGSIDIAIAAVRRVRYYRDGCKTGSKFHVSVGHSTAMATVLWFGGHELAEAAAKRQQLTADAGDGSSGDADDTKGSRAATLSLQNVQDEMSHIRFDWQQHYTYQDGILKGKKRREDGSEADHDHTQPLQWCLLKFERPVLCPPNSMLIGSRLDTDVHTRNCRLAFYGRIDTFVASEDQMHELRIFKRHEKFGVVDRVLSTTELVARDLFRKETDMTPLRGMKVTTMAGDVGVIDSSFGRSGKFHVKFPRNSPSSARAQQPICLRFRRYLFDGDKKMRQGEEVSDPITDYSPPEISKDSGAASKPAGKKGKKKRGGGGGTAKPVSTTPSQPPSQPPKQQPMPPSASAPSAASEAAVEAAPAPAPVVPAAAAPAAPVAPVAASREGVVDKLKGDPVDGRYFELIAKSFFSIEEDINGMFAGKRVVTAKGEVGEIKSSFGKQGKARVSFVQGTTVQVGDKLVLELS